MKDLLVIFDCDGVLVDSEHLSHVVLCDLFREHGIELSMEEAVERFMGTGGVGFLHQVGLLLGHAPPEFLETFRARCLVSFGESLTVIPGVAAALDQVTAMGGTYCVASNGTRRKMQFTLAHTSLLQRFGERIFSADDVAHPKPAPDLFLHAASTLGFAPSHTLVVEDSPTGIRAARAAGMHNFGYAAMTPRGKLESAGADLIFESMDQLPALLAAAQ